MKMVPGSSISLSHRTQFFKVLLLDSSPTKLQIPTKFHTHLPLQLPKSATLLCPHAISWDIEIHRAGPKIFFRRGWPEFIKAHDLRTGYFVVFRYNDNMKFEVEVFDTTCCLKDYSDKDCTRAVPTIADSEDPTDNDKSDIATGEGDGLANFIGVKTNSAVGKAKRKANKLDNVKREHIDGTSCSRPIYIEIDEPSESEDQTISKQSREIQTGSLPKRRKLSNSDNKEKEVFQNNPIVIQMEVPRRKTTQLAHNATSFVQFEKILTSSMVQNSMISIPKDFCVENNLITNCTISLRLKSEEGKVAPKEWRVGFFFGPKESRIRNGWTKFIKENNLKIGEKCIFQLVFKDTSLVQTELKNHIKMPSKKNRRIRKQSTISENGTKISIFVREYHLKYKYLSIPLKFCLRNKLISRREVVLKNLAGKEWKMIFWLNGSKEGRFNGASWLKFTKENELRAGDQLFIKVVTGEFMLFQVVKA